MDIHRGKKVGVWLSVAAVLAPLAVQIAGVAWIWTLLGSHPLFLGAGPPADRCRRRGDRGSLCKNSRNQWRRRR